MSTSLPLSRPIMAHGATVTSLSFNEPTGDDVLEIGLVSYFDKAGRAHIDMKAVGAYIVKLANIPMASVKQMAPADLVAASGVIGGFFGVSETSRKPSSEDTTSSQGSTAEA